MKEDTPRELTASERASELRQAAARLRQWSRELRGEFIRLQRATGTHRLSPARAGATKRSHERKPDGARWRSFALALNWVALAIVDVERHRMAGLLGWYQAQEERGVTPTEVAFLSGASRADANGSRRRSQRRSR